MIVFISDGLLFVGAFFQLTGIISIFFMLCDRHQDAISFSPAGD